MRPNLRMLGKLGLALLLVSLLVIGVIPPAPVSAATGVTNAWVQFTPGVAGYNQKNAAADYTIYFTPTTALSRGVDTITVWFPDGSSAMGPAAFNLAGATALTGADGNFVVDRDGEGTTYTPKRTTSSASLSTSGYRVTVTTPVDLSAGTAASLRIKAAATIKTANSDSTSAYKVKVYTSKDTTPTLSDSFYLAGSGIATAVATVALDPSTAGVAGQYTFTIDLSGVDTTALAGNTDSVTIIFPLGTTVPSTIDTTNVRVSESGATYEDAKTVTVNQKARMVTVALPLSVNFARDNDNRVRFLTAANVLNPTTAKAYTVATGAYAFTSKDQLQVEVGSYSTTAGTQTKLAFTSASDSATMVNMYSDALIIQAQDTNGNLVSVTPTVSLSSSSSSGRFYNTSYNEVSSIALSSGEVTVFYKDAPTDTTVGITATLTIAATNYTSGTRTMTIAPAVSLYDSNSNLIKTFAPTSGSPVKEADGYHGADYVTDAISAAVNGDTVKLGDGVYELDTTISLSKKVTLKSVNGASATTIKNTATIAKAVEVTVDGSSTQPVVIDGITFQSKSATSSPIRIAVFNSGNDYVTVQNNVFKNIEPNGGIVDGQGVVYFYPGDTITSATVSNNTFTDSVTTWPDIPAGGGMIGGKSGVIVFTTDFSGTAKMSGITISGNTITNSLGYAIHVKGVSTTNTAAGTISNNTITGGYASINVGSFLGTVKITGNTITDAYSYGIRVDGETDQNGNVTIKKNTITGNADWGIDVDGRSGTIIMQYNDLSTNNSGNIKNRQTTTTKDAKYNYYGSTSGPGSTVTAGLTTSPWLYKSKADVVTDNASYQAVKMSLVAGWNTLSTPVKLISTADAIDELITSGLTIGYYYGSSGWTQITAGYVLNPGDAVYLKMSAATTVYLKFDASAFTNPSKSLVAGWNLIGLASLQSSMAPDAAVASVKTTASNLPGYSQVVSPSVNSVQTDIYGVSGGDSWTYSSGQSAGSLIMQPGLGYWIYMQNAATLAGFEITPLVPNLN